MTETRVYSLSRDSDSLTGPHDQMEVFPTDFRRSLPPTTPIPSISGSQLVGGSMYAPSFPPTIGTGGATLNLTQGEDSTHLPPNAGSSASALCVASASSLRKRL